MDYGSAPANYNTHQPESPLELYETVAETYDRLYQSRAALAENEIVTSVLRGWINPRSRVVDVGCGTGLLYDLLDCPACYLGLDPSAAMLAKFKEKHPAINVICSKYEDVVLDQFDTKVALFGSPSYIDPAALKFGNMRNYFMMFYRDDHMPTIYKRLRIPFMGHRFSEYDVADSYVTEFADFVIVTDLR